VLELVRKRFYLYQRGLSYRGGDRAGHACGRGRVKDRKRQLEGGE
jgi:hypothetical protein